MIKICPNCKKEFHFWPYEKDLAKYCSRKCRKEYLGLKVNCLKCKKSFVSYISQKRKFCSKSCANSFNQLGIKSHYWTGGKTIRTSGYIAFQQPHHPFADNNGYVVEHRLVMEKQLGRFLTKEEIVHHINGNPADNRLENLKLYSSHSEHMKDGHPNHGFTQIVDKLEFTCPICSKVFFDYASNQRTFCSQKCYWSSLHK